MQYIIIKIHSLKMFSNFITILIKQAD